ncbi:hypothetical protein [Streptomyces sp. NPDC052727]
MSLVRARQGDNTPTAVVTAAPGPAGQERACRTAPPVRKGSAA